MTSESYRKRPGCKSRCRRFESCRGHHLTSADVNPRKICTTRLSVTDTCGRPSDRSGCGCCFHGRHLQLFWLNPSIAHRRWHRSDAIFSGLPGRRALNVRNLRRQTAALAWHTLATGSHHQPFSHCADRSRIIVRFWVQLRTHRSITSRWLTGQDPFAVTFVSLHRARQFEDPDTAPRCTGRDH